MTANHDRATQIINAKLIESCYPEDIAQALADAGLLRPPASERYDSTMTDLPSFAGHEDSPVDGPRIEASIERRYRKNTLVTLARVSIDLDGEHGTAYLNVDTSSEWCRSAAAILLDVADALDATQEKK